MNDEVETISGCELLMEFPPGEIVKDISPHCQMPGCCFLAVLTNRRHFHINIFTKEIEDEVPIN